MNSPDKNTFWPAAKTLWHRECTRFFRQRSRIIGAFVTPVLFWVLIGSGIGTSLQGSTAGEDTANYLGVLCPRDIHHDRPFHRYLFFFLPD